MVQQKASAVYVFSPRVDLIGHFFTFGFLALALAEMTIFPMVTYGFQSYENWVANILLFNGGHVVLTFVNCLCVKEFREIFRRKFTLAKVLVFYGALHLIFYKCFQIWDLNQPSVFGFLVFNATLFLPAFHALRQTTGLSLVLNHRHLQSLSEAQRIEYRSIDSRSRKREHWACYALILSSYIFGMKSAYFTNGHLAELALRVLGYGLFVGSVCGFILSFTSLKSKSLVRAKVVFNLRNVVRSLAPYSKFAALSGPSFHGIEYALLQTKVTRSRFIFSTYVVVLVAAAFLAIKTFCDYPYFLSSWAPFSNSSTILFLKSGGFALTYLHYYMDSIIFKMSDRDCRETTGEILLAPSATQQSTSLKLAA